MRILLADNQPRVRFALRALLAQRAGFEIVGEAVDAGELLAQAGTTHPDLIILDLDLEGLPAHDILPSLRMLCPDLFVIALSSGHKNGSAILAADAIISKMDPPEHLMAAIEACRHSEQT
jgi:DNA-binding NarL/FixJ family response regulator